MSWPHHDEQGAGPLQMLLHQLPRLSVNAAGQLDLLECPPGLLIDLAEGAEATAVVLNLGIAAIGGLMMQAALPSPESRVDTKMMLTIGQLIKELGQVSAATMILARSCRQALPNVGETP